MTGYSFPNFAALFLATLSPLLGQVTLIRAGRVLDVSAGRYLVNQGILIEAGRIKQLGEFDSVRAATPSGAAFLDLGAATVLPGLIDCHAHLLAAMDPSINGADELILTIAKYPPSKRVLLGGEMAKEDLEAGFTTVRNVGHSGIDGDVSLRDAIRAGWIPGPRIVASARKITPPGGQALPVQPALLQTLLDQEFLTAADPEQGRLAVLKNLRAGADLIKVVVDEGPSRLDVDTLRAIVAEAHKAGVRVAAHATSQPGIQAALDAGVDSIEHADQGTARQFELMREKNIFYVPTLETRDLVVRAQTTTNAAPSFGPARDPNADLDQYMAEQKSKLDLARKAGVKIAFGSDNWYAYPGKTRGEATLHLLEGMQEFGLPPADVLRAATVTAAELIGSPNIGAIAVGKYADLVALDGDPLANANALGKITFVMKGGVVVSKNNG